MAKTHARKILTDTIILNIKKCIFTTPIWILLGHIVCEEGIKVDFAKNKFILDLKPLVNAKQVRILLRHTGYYRKFISHYSHMTYPIEELLKENKKYEWTNEWATSFDILKKKLAEAPILRFQDWSIKFHVHDLYRVHALPLYSCINAICISRIDWVSYLLYAYTIPWIYKYPDCMISRYLDPITSDSSILISMFVWVLIRCGDLVL